MTEGLLDDIHLLAYCGCMEAEGDGIGAVYCVMHCVKNRVGAPTFPKTLHDVVYQHDAFSWTRPDNPEHGKEFKDTDPVWQTALQDAPNVLGGDSDPTGGALYYWNPKTADKDGWFARHIVAFPDLHPKTVSIFHHEFFK